MKTTVKRLRSMIKEVLYNAYRTKGGKRIGDPVRVDASSAYVAGEMAAKQFGDNTDPFTIDLEKIVSSQNNYPTEAQSKLLLIVQNIDDIITALDTRDTYPPDFESVLESAAETLHEHFEHDTLVHEAIDYINEALEHSYGASKKHVSSLLISALAALNDVVTKW